MLIKKEYSSIMQVMENKIMIVGLGNPGNQYQKTWHNAGFIAIEMFAERKNFSSFSISKNLQSETSEGIVNEKKTIIVKPLTFMNLSGIAVKKAIKKFGIDTGHLIVIHDDIDIPLGKVRISKNRGDGGHKGVASIIKELGSKNFTRIRIGILPEKKPKNVDTFVLKKITEKETPLFISSLNSVVLEIEKIISK